MTQQHTSRPTTVYEKKNKRGFGKLTAAEAEILSLLHDASKDKPAGGVTASGGCDLARTLKHDPRLRATDPFSVLCTQLVNEGWIIGHHYVPTSRTGIYSVSEDYASQLQSA